MYHNHKLVQIHKDMFCFVFLFFCLFVFCRFFLRLQGYQLFYNVYSFLFRTYFKTVQIICKLCWQDEHYQRKNLIMVMADLFEDFHFIFINLSYCSVWHIANKLSSTNRFKISAMWHEFAHSLSKPISESLWIDSNKAMTMKTTIKEQTITNAPFPANKDCSVCEHKSKFFCFVFLHMFPCFQISVYIFKLVVL